MRVVGVEVSKARRSTESRKVEETAGEHKGIGVGE